MPPMQGSDIEIQRPDGTWLGLMIARARDDAGNPIEGKPKSLAEILSAQDDELPISKRLIPRIIEDWAGGVGVDYNVAPGVYTRTPGYALPAGHPTAMTLPAAGASNSRIVKIVRFGNDLFAAQIGDGTANTARILRSTDNGTTWTVSHPLAGAGEYFNDLLVYNDPTSSTSAARLYASSADNTMASGNGRMHKWDGTTWTSTAPGDFTLGSVAYGRQALYKVLWTDNEGVSWWRLVTISGSKTISYTIPEGDPMDDSAAAWVEGVRIGTGINLLRLDGSRRHVFVSAGDNVFDIDELGDAIPLTSYGSSMIHGANGLALAYLDGYLYWSFGRGLDRIKVDEGPILQESLGQCAPGWATPAENIYRGWTTELCVDQGMLVNAMHNPSNGVTGIFWGKDRASLGVETRNPLVWYGPEVTIAGGYKVTAMTPVATAEDELALFFAASKGAALSDGPPIFYRVSLPVSGSPIQDLASGGKHRYATGAGVSTVTPLSELELLDEGWDDRASKKFLHEHTVVSRGLSVRDGTDDGFGTKMIFYDRADPLPGSTTWTSSADVLESPTDTVEPSDVVEGHKIGRKLRFVSPKGAESAAASVRVAVLDGIRTTAWRAVPSFQVLALSVEYGAGVLDLHNRQDMRDPDDVSAAIEELSQFGRTILRDRRGHRWTAKVEQVHAAEATYHDEPPGKSVQARIEITLIAELV
jgi:hypothetical protein